MELILWRHAEAEDTRVGMNDNERSLTSRGTKQAREMAHWLNSRLPKHTRILVSPALRTVQTAQALKLPFNIEPTIGTSASPHDLLAAANWPNEIDTTILVGHQPTLGRVAALLVSGLDADWAVKKGAVWWLSTNEGINKARIRAVLNPDLI